MTRRQGLVLLLALVVLAAPAAAAASVPDPTWIGGFYDGADGDELVALVWDQSPAIDAPPLDGPAPRPAARAAAGGSRAAPAGSRAPPAA